MAAGPLILSIIYIYLNYYNVLLMTVVGVVGVIHPLAHNINMKQKRMEAQWQLTAIFSERRKVSDKRNYNAMQCLFVSFR